MLLEKYKDFLDFQKGEKTGQVLYFNSYGHNWSNEQLEEVLTNCNNLEHFTLEDGKKEFVTHIPDAIGKLSKLTSFYTNTEKITHISEEIGKCKELNNIFIVSKNDFPLPQNLLQSPELKRLTIHHPNISIPKPIEGNIIGNLTISSKNPIQQFENLQYFTSLRTITIEAPINSKDFHYLCKLPNLRFLCVESEKLTKVQFDNHELERLENINITSSSLEEIQGINTIKTLDSISLNVPNIQNFSSFGDLDSLKYVHLTVQGKSTLIPQGLLANKQLKTCYLDGFGNETVEIGTHDLKLLSFKNFLNLQKVPSLNHLLLENLQLDKLPKITDLENIGLEEQKELIELVLHNLVIETIAPIGSKKVQSLVISGLSKIKDYTDILLNIAPKSFKIRGFSIKNTNKQEVFRFVNTLGKATLNLEEKKEIFHKFYQAIHNKKELPNLENESKVELLKMSLVSFPPLQKLVKEMIYQRIEEDMKQNPLDSKMKIAIVGSTGTSKKELKERLQDLTIEFHTKVKKDTTHIIIGQKVKKFEGLDNKSWVSEQAITDFLNEVQTPYLLEDEESEDSISNLRSLLLANEDSPLIAIEMLAAGGVPQELFLDLLFVQKTSTNSKIKTKAKKILQANAGVIYENILADRTRFIGTKNEKDIYKQFEKFREKFPQIDWIRFAIYFYKKFKKGLRFVCLNMHDNVELQEEILSMLREGTLLNYSKGYANDYIPDYWNMYAYHTYKAHEIPSELWKQTGIESLMLKALALEEVPKELMQFKQLKELDLSLNKFKTLPLDFASLENLEILHLSENELEGFPEVLLSMKNLKEVHLRFNRKEYQSNPIQITEKIKNKLPNCKIMTH